MIGSKITFQLVTGIMYENESLFSRTSVSKYKK